ncbi:MAG: YbaB/EbfC family nucleoid-associated protein [Actinophytocola sp.]|uniref:YbaB/EbfC family nucleoid-associated protein n=1 Tax=Actinophytocola sp. TaxID=1872138 RepID=UPI003C789674
MADHRAQVVDLLAGYRRSREQLGAVQRSLATVRETVTSEGGLVAVTVSASGTIVDLAINDDAYRVLRPAALAELIVRTTAEATARVTRKASEVLAPVVPSDTDPAALLRGTADLSADELTPAPAADFSDETFEDKSWMQSGGARDARRV